MPRLPLLKRLLPLLLCAALAACDRMPTVDRAGVGPGSPLVALDMPQLAVLGAPTGPWKLVEVKAPTHVVLSKDGRNAEVAIFGLDAEEYPNPEAKPGVPLEPEERERLSEIREYKRQALAELLAEQPIWVVGLSEEQIPYAHLFFTQQPGDAKPQNKVIYVPALALRRGIASMTLEEGDFEMRETMLDCQFAAIAESLHEDDNRAQSKNIWSRFDLRLPPKAWDARIKAMETMLGLNEDGKTKPAAK